MDSTIFNRRTLLGSGAFVGLGALLAACGQQANNEAAATATAAPSETASASTAVSDATSASATPSPRVTRGYSGNSKAPDGEYRKADGYGPAQNVPKPRNEPAQYPENEEGLIKMMQDWVVAHNYGIQTGDCSYAKKYVSESTEEYKFYEYLEGLYQRGGWVIEGLDSYQQEGIPVYNEKQKIYRMKIRVFWSIAMYIEPDGKITKQANTNKDDDKFNFFFSYSNGYWKIIGSGEGDELKDE
ncbi:DUF6318 family protein [uncultured Rothia sp.]|uniref:DUF6318 family protein n=1 Tax=uncultured Rothia sp. TaxID=316088 RepID=UPI0025F860D0|nr:DUF6318 family protein [uncultured Rothia sp.]